MHKIATSRLLLVVGLCVIATLSWSQVGSSGTIEGVVKDSSGAVVPNAKVELSYSVSGFHRETISGDSGEFRFTNVPFNPYHLVIKASGFAPFSRDLDVRSSVPVGVQVALAVASESTTVTVEAHDGDLNENDPNFHTDVDRELFNKLLLVKQPLSCTPLLTHALRV